MKRMLSAAGRRAASAVAVAGLTVGGLVLTASPASAEPSCVAQSVQAEHEVYGTAWGHDVIAYLASHPEVVQEHGFDNFGELASFSAHQDRTACPTDL